MVYCYEEIRMVHYDHVKGGNSKCSSIYKTKRQYGYKNRFNIEKNISFQQNIFSLLLLFAI